jgi:hypothetical protein
MELEGEHLVFIDEGTTGRILHQNAQLCSLDKQEGVPQNTGEMQRQMLVKGCKLEL